VSAAISKSEFKSEILIVAGEASSELYATRILEECKQRKLDYHFFGIGSARMKALGCEIVEESEKMAVVGLVEVISHWRTIAGAFRKLVSLAKERKPRLVLLLDYPDFNLRLAKKMNHLGIPVIYYISPQVWAWRSARVHLIKEIVAKMLVVFPFEKDFYEKFKVPVTFVGHPLLDELKKQNLTESLRKTTRDQLGVRDDEFLIALLPGSRRSELKYNFEAQLKAAEIIAAKKPKARFLILVAPSLDVEVVRSYLPNALKLSIRLVKDEPLKILQACDSGILASGTATLIAGLAETPMVIMYKMNKLTGFLAKRLVKGPDFFGMTNLILREQAVPELFQEQANPDNLAQEIIKYIDDPDYRLSVVNKLSTIKSKLGDGGANARVVDELVAFMSKP
jgi:lipid-A-disaccharide synthase